MVGEKYVIFLTLALAMLIILPSVSASITMDAPSELISNSVAKITLHFNEPLIERYAKNIKIDCEGCFAASKTAILYNNGVVMGPIFRRQGILNIPYSGEKTLSFFIVGSYSDPAEDENAALANTANVKLAFKLDEDKMKKDYPDMAIPIDGAYLSKKFDILDSELIITLPKIGEFEHKHFVSDRYTNGPPDISIAEYTFEDTNYYTRYYTVDVDSEICTGDEKGDKTYLCGGAITQEMIDTGKDNNGGTLKKINWHDGEGYAIVQAYVVTTFKVWEGGKVKFNAAVLSLGYAYSILDEETGTNYFGSLHAESAVKEGFQDVFYETTAREFEEIINSTHLKKIGSRMNTYDVEYKYMLSDFPLPDDVEEKEDDGECVTNQDCSEEKVCNSCGECVEEDKVYDEDEVTLKDVSFKTEFTDKKIINKIDSLIIARTTLNIKLTNSDGKTISYCDLRPGSFKNLVLHGEIKEDDRYSGFTSGMLYDKRDKKRDRAVDLSEDPLKIAFFISPNDREKFVGDTKDIKEHVTFTLLNGNEELYKDEYEYLLESYDSDVEIKTNSKQMQQDSSKAISFKINNKYAKDVVVKVKLFGIGGIEENDPSIKHTEDDEIVSRKSFFDTFKPGKEYKFAYYSPELGNADIGQALAGLSMAKLQQKGVEATVKDTLSLGIGHGMEQGAKALSSAQKASSAALSGARKYFKAMPGAYSADKAAKLVQDLNYVNKYSKNFNKVKGMVDTGNQIYGLTQVQGATSSTLKGYDDLKNPKKIKKSWAEKIGEAGVTGINGLQGSVGVVMLVAGKVPGFGPLAQAIFSATTNIWKANFQYIADSEKIERIQELFWPNLIMVEASDESGWTTRSLVVVKVAYHQI